MYLNRRANHMTFNSVSSYMYAQLCSKHAHHLEESCSARTVSDAELSLLQVQAYHSLCCRFVDALAPHAKFHVRELLSRLLTHSQSLKTFSSSSPSAGGTLLSDIQSTNHDIIAIIQRWVRWSLRRRRCLLQIPVAHHWLLSSFVSDLNLCVRVCMCACVRIVCVWVCARVRGCVRVCAWGGRGPREKGDACGWTIALALLSAAVPTFTPFKFVSLFFAFFFFFPGAVTNQYNGDNEVWFSHYLAAAWGMQLATFWLCDASTTCRNYPRPGGGGLIPVP